jgi:hypothetical protein
VDPRIVRRNHQPPRAVDLRPKLMHLWHFARLLLPPFSTLAHILSSLDLGRLRNLESTPPRQRYEGERFGDPIHIDDMSLARLRLVGQRVTGDRQQGRS